MQRLIFEAIPPPQNWNTEKKEEWAMRIGEILRKNGIYFLNLPEVVNGRKKEGAVINFLPKMDNLYFSELVANCFLKTKFILNKICVLIKKECFEEWVSTVYKKGITHILIVGGESRKIDPANYSVLEAAAFCKKNFPRLKIGGITIFSRKNEAERIVEKMKKGVEFFVSQIIFETANMKQVLRQLQRLTKIENLPFPMIYVSLAPAARIKDIEFMRWFGIEFPSEVFAYLKEKENEVEKKTFEILNKVIDEIFDFMEKEQIKMGFNIEHVMYNNLELSEKLLKTINERMKK